MTHYGLICPALRLQEAIRCAGGVSRAVDIIEQAVATGKPVIS